MSDQFEDMDTIPTGDDVVGKIVSKYKTINEFITFESLLTVSWDEEGFDEQFPEGNPQREDLLALKDYCMPLVSNIKDQDNCSPNTSGIQIRHLYGH